MAAVGSPKDLMMGDLLDTMDSDEAFIGIVKFRPRRAF